MYHLQNISHFCFDFNLSKVVEHFEVGDDHK
jgi:hypothetical protein